MNTANDLLRRALECIDWHCPQVTTLREEIRAYLDLPKDDNGKIPYEVLLNYCAEINRAYANLVDKLHGDEVKDEPVAWVYKDFDKDNAFVTMTKMVLISNNTQETPLYLHPPTKAAPMKPMTEEEIEKGIIETGLTSRRLTFYAGIRFAERHHGIGSEDE